MTNESPKDWPLDDMPAAKPAPPRIPSTKSLREIAEFLWDLLDNIDTAEDVAKENDKFFRQLVHKHHRRRFEVGTTDGYGLTLDSDKS